MTTPVLLFSNNAQTTLAGPITSTATSLNVAAGTGVLFPSPGSGQAFKLTLVAAADPTVNEILLVTSVSSDTFTVTRAQEGTEALNWLAGDFAYNWLTAGTMSALAQSSALSSSFYEGADTGSANAVNVPTLVPALSVPVQGQIFVIIKGSSSNTGAVAMQINGGTSYSVVYKDGTALNAADWPANAAAILYFTGSVYQFLSCQPNTPMASVPCYGVDTSGSVNAIVASVTPAVSALTVGRTYLIKLANTVTGATTANLNSIGATPVKRADGSALQANDILAGELVPLVFDGTNLQVLGLNPVFIPAGILTDFTAGTHTFTPPAGVFAVSIQAWGAGGGGGGCSGGPLTAGSGGGGGEYRTGVFAVTPGVGVTVVVGAAGTAGSTSPTNGAAGGATTFGSVLTANGGGGGLAGVNALQVSGSGSGGSGGSGGVGISGTGGGIAFEINSNPVSGQGGAAGLGGGVTLLNITTAGGASPGNSPGGGGSAASGTAGLAAAGADGFMIIQSV